MQTYFVSLWEYSKHFHGSFEWHLTPYMTLCIETCNRWAPCIKGVRLIQVLLYLETCLVTQNYCEECSWCALIAVFSLNFSSAGKGPFIAGKPKKYAPEMHFPGGIGVMECRTWLTLIGKFSS